MQDSSQHLIFGPPGNEWQYDKETKTYDLTRGYPASGWNVATTQGPPDTNFILAPNLTTLVVVDMQNFFLHPLCNDYPDGLAAADRVLHVAKKCREVGIRIVWLNWNLTEADLDTMPAATERSFSNDLFLSSSEPSKQARRGFGSDMGEGRGRLLMQGEWNAELYPTLDASRLPGHDIVCVKNRISGLWSPEAVLSRHLRGTGSRTLLFAGVNTDQCVFGTLADAYYQGFDCVLLEDCCATKTPHGNEVTIWNVSRGYGFVTNTKAFLDGFH
ncbi:isochorismatase [Xylariaceae sp. FL0255]|nr:isochorismatase [Xylariaceae sp. FL0255]